MLRFVFWGTPEFAVPTLERLERAGRRPQAVVCQPDRPRGRGQKVAAPPVKVWAAARGVLVLQPQRQKEAAFLERLRSLEFDLGLVVAFGQLLPPVVLDLPPLGFLNLHPSLLPRYRGAAPMQWTLIRGDAVSGVSILRVTPRLDDGDIVLQREVEVSLDETAEQLHDRLAVLGGELTLEALERFEKGNTEARPQDETQVVWAPALTKRDGWVDWRAPAREIHNRIRGLQPWPGATTRLGEREFKIHRAALEDAPSPVGCPGEVVVAEADDLIVRAAEGALRILEIQQQGRKRMDARSFLLGRPLRLGDVFDCSEPSGGTEK